MKKIGYEKSRENLLKKDFFLFGVVALFILMYVFYVYVFGFLIPVNIFEIIFKGNEQYFYIGFAPVVIVLGYGFFNIISLYREAVVFLKETSVWYDLQEWGKFICEEETKMLTYKNFMKWAKVKWTSGEKNCLVVIASLLDKAIKAETITPVQALDIMNKVGFENLLSNNWELVEKIDIIREEIKTIKSKNDLTALLGKVKNKNILVKV
jgi:hypothetical protein